MAGPVLDAPPRLKLTDHYLAWKKLAPYLYDFLIHDKLTWPCLSCRWGPLVPIERGRGDVHRLASSPQRQQLYLSEQTDGSAPNKLIILEAELPAPHTTAASDVHGWSEQGHSPALLRDRVRALILHPGEINRLRELPTHPHVVVTLTDKREAFVWNMRTQPVRGPTEVAPASKPDILLKGHKAELSFALACCAVEPVVATGAKDGELALWDLGTACPAKLASEDEAIALSYTYRTPISPTLRLTGHTKAVEDAAWRPGSPSELASVGDDGQLLLWDTRTLQDRPVFGMCGAHGVHDVHAVDWSINATSLATGAANGSVKVWDVRKLAATGKPVLEAKRAHSAAVLRVEWNPSMPSMLATSGDDGMLCLWDTAAVAGKPGGGAVPPDRDLQGESEPPLAEQDTLVDDKQQTQLQLIFRHAGHRTPVVDFQWNPVLPWTIMSVSDDAEDPTGGGTLQLWRVSDLLTRPEEEVLAELDQYRSFIGTGTDEDLARCQAKLK